MKTLSPKISKLIEEFRRHSCEPAGGYVWAIQHEMFGFSEFSQLEPWHFCSFEEIVPLYQRWPRASKEPDCVPFARRQDRDDLACFSLHGSPVIRVVHYNLGPPTIWKTEREHGNFWDWVKAVIGDVEVWSSIQQRKRKD